MPPLASEGVQRKDMVCRKCIKFDDETRTSLKGGSIVIGPACRLNPTPQMFNGTPLSPDTHWCGQGKWHGWDKRYQELADYKWGEWPPEDSDVYPGPRLEEDADESRG